MQSNRVISFYTCVSPRYRCISAIRILVTRDAERRDRYLARDRENALSSPESRREFHSRRPRWHGGAREDKSGRPYGVYTRARAILFPARDNFRVGGKKGGECSLIKRVHKLHSSTPHHTLFPLSPFCPRCFNRFTETTARPFSTMAKRKKENRSQSSALPAAASDFH